MTRRGVLLAAGLAPCLAAACVAVLGLAWPHAAAAQALDLSHGGPVEVTARGGFEWHETEQRVIAFGDARAVRDNVTVLADRLIALYRKKAGTAAATPAAGTPAAQDQGGNEVYRLLAEGNVRILSATDEAVGDKAVYDIDQAVLVMTGAHMKLTTPQQVMTARDTMEYWSQRHMSVGRGNATVVTTDGRRVSADVLVGYSTNPDDPAAAARPAAAPAAASADPLAASGKLQRVEAFGNVEVRTATDLVRGDRGVYLPDTGLARIVGHVRITHNGQNQLNGPAADVNMKTGVAHMIADPGGRVEGLIMPNDANSAAGLAPGAAAPAAKPLAGQTTPKTVPQSTPKSTPRTAP